MILYKVKKSSFFQSLFCFFLSEFNQRVNCLVGNGEVQCGVELQGQPDIVSGCGGVVSKSKTHIHVPPTFFHLNPSAYIDRISRSI
jgi:hypothetical protein